MIVMGIDPGVTGAIAVFDTDRMALDYVFDIPTFEVKVGRSFKRRVNIPELLDLIRETTMFDVRLCVIEEVGGLPGQSAAAGFSFGFTCGAIHAAVAVQKIPIQTVPSSIWKRKLGVPADKDGARFIASRLFPVMADEWKRKKDDGRAEAALIALYGARHVLGVQQ